MANTKTPQEIRQHHIELMGEELGEIYNSLLNEFLWLHEKWKEYVQLFGTKPSRIELLNQTAGFFFRIVQDSLWNDILLHLCRLTDPVKSSGKSNLTIKLFPGLLPEGTFKKKIDGLIKEIDSKTEFSRDWRNRYIGHTDYDLALKKGTEPLKPASRKKVKAAIESISKLMNEISGHYLDSETFFEGFENIDGAISLLYVIDDGLRVEEERRKRVKEGDYSIDDYRPREP